MLGAVTGILPPLDLSALLQLVATVLLVFFAFLLLLRNASSRYFVVDTGFESGGYEEARAKPMSIGQGEEPNDADAKCFVCGRNGSKICGKCRNVRYCSLDCQKQHWEAEHKVKCRKKGTGIVALVPERRVLKVLHQPKKILFPYEEFIKLYYWEKQVFPPCGLLNCGNSCFANAVLQCLSCTRPLVGYLLEGAHSRECRRNDWCFLCELQSHVKRVTNSFQAFSPLNILSQLPNIGRHLGYGRQEDAHEFMRFAIDTMQSVCLDEFGGEKALDSSTQETTLIQHIFGGHLQSQVRCTKCNVVSNRYENMMDLTVEIQGDAESLEACLNQFTAKEWLDGENMYKCDGCNDYVKALKQLTVHVAPNILTVTLKRFQSGRFGKLNKRVAFPETLDLGSYMSCNGRGDNLYTLYAVVVHLDMLNASFFGHYICYTKDFSGNWYRVDDCKVTKVELDEVLSQGAYMLLYNRLQIRQSKPSQISQLNVPQSNEVASVSSNTSESINMMGTTVRNNISVNDDIDMDNVGKPNINGGEDEISFMGNIKQVKRHVDEEKSLQSKEMEVKLSQTFSSHTRDMLMDHQLTLDLLEKKESSSTLYETNEISHDSSTPAFSLRTVQEKSDSNPLLLSSFDSKLDKSIEGNSSNEYRKIDNGLPPDQDNKRAGHPSTTEVKCTCYVETKPLFRRGFLDKPSKKKAPHGGSIVQRVDYPISSCTNDDLSALSHSPGGNSETGHSPGGNSEPGHSHGGYSEPGQSHGGNSEPGHSHGGNSEPGHSPGGNSGGNSEPGHSPGGNSGGNSEPGHSPGRNSEPGHSPGRNSEPSHSPGRNSEPSDSPGRNSEPSHSSNGNSESSHTPNGDSESIISSGLSKDLDVEGNCQSRHHEVSSYNDDVHLNNSFECDSLKQDLHHHKLFEREAIRIRSNGSCFDTQSIDNHSIESQTNGFHRNYLQENGSYGRDLHSPETCQKRESESTFQWQHTYQGSINANNNNNNNNFTESSSLFNSVELLDKISQESQNDIHAKNVNECKDVDFIESKKQLLQSSQPTEPEAALQYFLNHNRCQKSSSKNGDWYPDAFVPVFNEADRSHIFSMGNDCPGGKPSMTVPIPRNFGPAHEKHDYQDSPAIDMNRLLNLEVPLNCQTCLNEAGCCSIAQNQSNVYCHPNSENRSTK